MAAYDPREHSLPFWEKERGAGPVTRWEGGRTIAKVVGEMAEEEVGSLELVAPTRSGKGYRVPRPNGMTLAAWRKRQGQCVRCGAEPEIGSVRCRRCIDLQTESSGPARQRRKRLAQAAANEFSGAMKTGLVPTLETIRAHISGAKLELVKLS